jgi:hypothetical protein
MPTGLNDLAARLAALPDLDTPVGGWDAVLAAKRTRRSRPAFRWPAVLALATPLGAAGLALLLWHADGEPVQSFRPAGPALLATDAIRIENARLEELLAALPERRSMRGSTAFTVAAIEDRLAAVDDRLSVTVLQPHAPEHADQLWRERAELLDSLVKVRYADLARSQ